MREIVLPRLVIAGTASGVGKTMVVMGLARAFKQRGLRVAAFKCGPDYLDPGYHARATGAPSQNLDGWMMGRDAVRATFERASRDADIALIEGVMGLFDGASPTDDAGSTSEIARWLSAPVLLVVDASGMARSIAALVQGFARFDERLKLAGVLANRVGSARHLELLRRAQQEPPIWGGLTEARELTLAERHLGLHVADENALPERVVEAWARRVAEECDMDAILAAARGAPALALADDVSIEPLPSRVRIGVAYDAAFNFYYDDNLRRLERAGATLVRFSPVADAHLPAVDGVYVGGGYPELCAEALAGNVSFLADMRAFCASGRPVYAECGGLMYLSRAIVAEDGRSFPMLGLIAAEARMMPRLQALGYVEVETERASLLGPAGTRFRGHQFRYSELRGDPGELDPIYRLRTRRTDQVSTEGYAAGSVLGSYVHAHWASNPTIPEAFVAACQRGRGEPC